MWGKENFLVEKLVEAAAQYKEPLCTVSFRLEAHISVVRHGDDIPGGIGPCSALRFEANLIT